MRNYKQFLCNVVLVFLGTVVCEKDIGRRRTVPVIYVSGSHYDVGFDTGRTFASIIKSFIATCDRLRDFEEQYKTAAGKEAYDNTLANMKARYPWYLKELQGVGDGAKVPFYQLFLLQLDDIIETINENNIVRNDTGGCSSIGINNPINAVLGHTEDAFSETLNHFYILSAHVIPTPEDKELGATEERFSSLCYAGQLPGYTSGFNEYGMVFSINTLSPRNLKPGNTPRTFITRALLAATSPADAERILLDDGLGAANGFSLNLLWTEGSGRTNMFNIEVAPDPQANRSLLSVRKYENGGESLAHVNRYQRIPVAEVRGPIIDSSVARMNQIKAHSPPVARRDIEDILSDQTGKEYRVFQDSKEAIVVTITAGIFDLNARTWSLYINKPNVSEPIAILPIIFNKLPL